jgi:25S rRNA (adenine2142-N1)-methyltransferase
MHSIDFAPVKERWKVGGKMAYWLFRRDERVGLAADLDATGQFRKKTILKQGNRNNFCILLSPS